MVNINKLKLIWINCLFIFLPTSLILGSFIVNLNIILLIVIGLFFFNKEVISSQLNKIDKIVLVLFIYIFLVLSINYFEKQFNNSELSFLVITKTFFYFRFLAFYLIIRILVEKKILNLKFFNISCSIAACFVCLDLFYQFIFDKNIFGLSSISSRHLSGVFGDELIAGSYLQKFSIFFLFTPIIWSLELRKKIIIQYFIISIFCLGIILSGNRMPLLLYFFSIFIYFFFNKGKKKNTLKIFLVLFLVTLFTFFTYKNFRLHATNFYNNGINLIKSLTIKDISKASNDIVNKPYVIVFYCAKQIIKINPYFGGGIRSYRTIDEGCNSHPHNYYLEILSDLGLFGLVIFVIMFVILFRESILSKIKNKKFNYLYWPFFLIICSEVFPIKTSGSIFTTKNSVIIFLSLSVLATLISKNKLKK